MRLRDTVSTPRRGEKGFTITEVLVATTLTAVALVAVSSFNRFQLLTLRNQANQIDLQTTARSVVDLFAREIRRAGANPTCVGGLSALTDAKTYSVRVVADLNRDGATNGANEDLTYRYNLGSNTVERVDQNGGTTDVLVSGASLGNSRIRYFDGNGTELIPNALTGLTAAQRASVRRIRIQLSLSAGVVNPVNSPPFTAEVATDVDLRNRFFVGLMPCPS